MKKAQEHYGCPSIPSGLELENQGGTNNLFSHWERRVLGNELMTASQSLNPVFSAITMAFLKDTGWYDVDYNFADKFFYGKDEGCDFLTKACFDGRGEPNFQ